VRKAVLAGLIIVAMLVLPAIAMYSTQTNPVAEPLSASAAKFVPSMNIPAGVDKDHNKVADSLDQEITSKNGSASDLAKFVNVTVMLKTAPTTSDLLSFASSEGVLTTSTWTYAIFGFGGHIPYGKVLSFSKNCPDLLLVEKEAVCNASLAYAATQIGARPYVWNNLGLQGDPNSAVAIIDTGIDASHPDFSPGYGNLNFADKIIGWNDQVTSTTSPYDDNGHGSHCSGLAAGNGFFSVDSSGYATATWSANLGAVSTPGTYPMSGMMVNKTGLITLKVEWTSTGRAGVSAIPLYYGGKNLNTGSWSQVASVSTPNENTVYTLSYNVASTPSGGYDLYHPTLTLTRGTGDLYVAFTMSWPYSPPSDGFSAWTGLAPQSKLVGVKALDSTGLGSSNGLISGINWVIANKMNYHITVASMSLGFSAEVTTVDSAVANLLNAGISTVVAAGNDGTGTNNIFTPGSVDEVITVAAMNQFDDITSYSSQGGTSRYIGNTVKPDITAPGGSFYGAPLYSVDSNYNDAEGVFSDLQPNDAAPEQGTSMATPVVSGAVELIVQAMGGYSAWNWTRSQALTPKMILLMTATETYPNLREAGTAATSPTLDRGGKDVHEGYGRINVNSAADAVLKTYKIGTTVTDSLGSPPIPSNIAVLGQSLAWARNVQLLAGTTYNFSLTVPAGADYDLYLYNTTGTSYGEPIIDAKSTTAALGGFENISYTATISGQYYLVVKLAYENSGSGQFTLTSTPKSNVHLMLSENPILASYTRGQSVTFTVDVLNQLNPALNSTLSLTITGPNSYYNFDFQAINMTADSANEYSFSWNIPNVAGTYVVQTNLIPAQLTAYDSQWIKVI
jgi:subtilisin family serine protease